MKKITIVLTLIVLSLISKSQPGMPYLNYSAGNQNQSVTGPDSSVYAFNGFNLMKIRKNLTTAWAFDYSGLVFTNLLLSKTGSLFFLTGDKIGKINASTGNLVWVKALSSVNYTYNANSINSPIIPLQLLLNRNNEILVTGVTQAGGLYSAGFILKLDTSGNSAAGSVVYPSNNTNSKLDNLHIVSDSLGFYKCYFSTYNSFSGTNGFIFDYNSNLTTINPNLKQVDFYGITSQLGIAPVIANFRKSVTNPNNFLVVCSLSDVSNLNFSFEVRKYSTLKKLKNFTIQGSYYGSMSFCEDKMGGSTVTVKKFVTNNPASTQYSVINLDTNLNRTSASLFYIEPGVFPIYQETLYPFYPQSTYINPRGSVFPFNQLTLFNAHTPPACVQNFTLGNGSICNTICNFLNTSVSQILVVPTSTVPLAATYSLTPFSSSVTSMSLPASQNYCALILGTEDLVLDNSSSLRLFPNPSAQFVTFEQQTNEEVMVTIENNLGQIVKQLPTSQLQTRIDLKDLAIGCYLVKVSSRTSKNTKVLKLIKE